MGGGGIHVQLLYTVINVWRINVLVEGAFMCSYHTQSLTCGGLTCGGGIHVQLTNTVINVWRINVWVEGAFTCSYHTQ